MQQLINYFTQITDVSYRFLDQIRLSSETKPLEQLLYSLSLQLETAKNKAITDYTSIIRPKLESKRQQNALGTGMNTIGMLVDRLTILIIKEWCLRNKMNANLSKADHLYETHTLDMIYALANAQPGSSAMNTKITHVKATAQAHSWEEAFYGLFATNIILWESQEVLYVRDISILPSEELRSYIQWFSQGNVQRNAYIQLCEQLYWQQE